MLKINLITVVSALLLVAGLLFTNSEENRVVETNVEYEEVLCSLPAP